MGKGLTFAIEKTRETDMHCDYAVYGSLKALDHTEIFFMRVMRTPLKVVCATDKAYKNVFCTIPFDECDGEWIMPEIEPEFVHIAVDRTIFSLAVWKLCAALKKGIFPECMEHIC